MLHGARSPETIDAIERAADDILLPLRGATLRSALRSPEPVVGVALQGTGLAVSTIKESEDGRSLVLRCVNLLDDTVAGSWTVPFDVAECFRARLDETIMQGLSSTERVIAFDAKPREIVTILVR
jgi:alpha-mannosidase